MKVDLNLHLNNLHSLSEGSIIVCHIPKPNLDINTVSIGPPRITAAMPAQ